MSHRLLATMPLLMLAACVQAPILDYELSGHLRLERTATREQADAEPLATPGRLVQFPMLQFRLPSTEARFEIVGAWTYFEFRRVQAQGFEPDWAAATVERPDAGASVPLRCQSVSVDRQFRRDARPDAAARPDFGASFPQGAGAGAARTSLSCAAPTSFQRLFATGQVFGAELTREPLSARLTEPGTSLCFHIPGRFGAEPATVRLCVTGRSVKARLVTYTF